MAVFQVNEEKTIISKHDIIQSEVYSICSSLGFNSSQEYSGKDWRADILAEKDTKKFAFEIQISLQSLKKTIERQSKYLRDNIVCCWLFEKSPSKLTDERPDLPLFNIIVKPDNSFFVSLSDRKELPLAVFIKEFLSERIKFCNYAYAFPKQQINLIFYEMECWKCKTMNHIYYVDSLFRSSCNAIVHPDEAMWDGSKIEYRPDVIKIAEDFAKTNNKLKLATLKKRYSNTVQHSYMSFGCNKCDSIFGDWFIMEAEIDVKYGKLQIANCNGTIDLDENIKLDIPHWCYPENFPFCDQY